MFLSVRQLNRNYSRRQVSGLPFEAILRTRRQVANPLISRRGRPVETTNLEQYRNETSFLQVDAHAS
jgi:hypothetical protein